MQSKLYLNLSTNFLYFKHIWNLKWTFYLGIFSFCLSIPLGISFDNLYAGVVGLIGILISTLSIYVESKKNKLIDENHLLVESTIFNKELKLDGTLVRAGYKINYEGLGQIIQSPKLNEYLFNGGLLFFELNNKKWLAPTEILEEWQTKLLISAKRERRIIFDSKKVRLVSDPIVDLNRQTVNIEIQPTSYMQGFWTNEAARFDLKLESRTIFRGSSLFIHDSVISPLGSTQNANFIGISTLLIGNGVVLPVVRQSARSAISNSKIAPSGSGSMDWEDIYENDENFNQIICRAAERELREEMGLPFDIVLKSQVIGFQRLIGRGGKPEFFCVTWLEDKFDSVKLSKAEKLFTHHADALPVDWGKSPKQIANQLVKLNKENALTFSQALQNSLLLFAEALMKADAKSPFLIFLQNQQAN